MTSYDNLVFISIPSVLDDAAAPAGHHVLHAYLPATEPYADWVGLDREAYREKKEARAVAERTGGGGRTLAEVGRDDQPGDAPRFRSGREKDP